MSRWSRPKLLRWASLPMIMAGLAVSGADAQTPSRPTFDLTQHPDLYINVWPADLNRDGKADLVAGTRALFCRRSGRRRSCDGARRWHFFSPQRRWTIVRSHCFRPTSMPTASFDLLILRGRSLEVLPGNGDGTFDAARVIDRERSVRELRTWPLPAIEWRSTPRYHRARRRHRCRAQALSRNGTFAFGPPIILPTSNYLPAELAERRLQR